GARWSPDCRRIAFFAARDERWLPWRIPSDGTDPDRRWLKTNTQLVTEAWCPDGRFVIFGGIDPQSRQTELPVQGIEDLVGAAPLPRRPASGFASVCRRPTRLPLR